MLQLLYSHAYYNENPITVLHPSEMAFLIQIFPKIGTESSLEEDDKRMHCFICCTELHIFTVLIHL